MSIKQKIRKLFSPIRKIGLTNRDFTLISNNCWGGVVYQTYGIKYLSPTIGVWISPKHFNRFCSNLKYYLSLEPIQITWTQSDNKELLESKKHLVLDELIIGKIDDVEIYFVHENDFAIAKEKWIKRSKRVNFDNIIIKLNDQNGFELNDYEQFEKIPYKNKLFFTAKKELIGKDDVVYFSKFENKKYVVDDIKTYPRYINIKKYINEAKK